MDSVRQQKYSRLIQKELGELFQREGRNWYGNNFITITGVKITPDLGLARIQVSIFKATDPKAVLKSINTHISEIRKELGNRIGKQARIVPQLEFFIDSSMDYVEHIDKLFKNLHIPPAEEENSDDN